MYIVEECGLEEFHGCKYVLLFFSAGWCPPCEQFLQVIKDFYSEVNIDQKLIEVLYISSDKTEADFKETYAKMPWMTVSYSNALHKNLISKYEITGVPIIYVMEAQSGFIITKKGRKDICDLGVGCMKTWNDEMPGMMAKVKHLNEGAAVVEAKRLKDEEEAKKKAAAEKDD